MAAHTTQLHVTGRIVAAPCSIALGGNGNADFGDIATTQLPLPHTPPKKIERSLPFSITYAWSTTREPDNRPFWHPQW